MCNGKNDQHEKAQKKLRHNNNYKNDSDNEQQQKLYRWRLCDIDVDDVETK